MKFLNIKLLIIAIVMFAANSAFAALSYDVTIDTSYLNTTNGYLYYQYGGLNAVDSTATLYGYSGGVLAASNSSAVIDGSAVSGTLPGAVRFANTHGTNDYNHGITFGNSITFGVSFAAPAFGGIPGGSSTFSLGLYQDENGSIPLLNGTLFTINLMNDGTATAEVLAGQGVDVTPTPIPAAVWLLGSGLLGLAGVRRRATK